MTTIDFDIEARKQIFAIQDYISHELQSPRAALKTVREIIKAIRLLENFPDSGSLLTNIYQHVHPDLQQHRRIITKNYIVIYLYLEQENKIHIQSVYDSRTDYLSRISDA